MNNEEYGKIIAKNLRRIMYDSGKTQADVARDLKINKATISSWMNGTRIPRMPNIDLLCHYFNVSRADIMEEPKVQISGLDEEYYEDAEIRDIVDLLHKSPKYRILMSASKRLSKKDLELIIEMVERMS